MEKSEMEYKKNRISKMKNMIIAIMDEAEEAMMEFELDYDSDDELNKLSAEDRKEFERLDELTDELDTAHNTVCKILDRYNK